MADEAAQREKSTAAAAAAATTAAAATSRDFERGRPDAPTPPVYCALTPARRRFVLGVVTVAGLFGPLAGAIYLPSLPVLEREFGVGATALNATVSVFMVTFAFAPLFWASFADHGGRRPPYVSSLSVYIVANVLLATLPKNFGALVFLRIVQAFGSAAVVSMGAGTVVDVTEPKRRATAMSIFLLGPQCGPIIGPALGAALTGEVSWRWIFGFLAISGFVLWLVIVLTLPETLRYRVGNGRIHAQGSTEPETRLVDQIWGVLLCAAGTIMYGWFVAGALHPAAVLLATFLTGFGMSWVFIATTAFLSECAPQQAAGAFALGNMLRNPGAAISAVILPRLVSSMGVGWFFTGLGLLDLVVVGGAVTVLRIYGPVWRARRWAEATEKPG
ncbi:MFS transporter [Ophiocordyceps sinensis CO18]|uniref:MFS transporter n=1 Tax=Ophiocordyceps sinensis (strain Co18 / CGMCC 3.14243) TaxID=911162 RepID=T5ACH0_OPHSC|nr:MFS transporter [Ophiocordyceps sinensis CO18]